jgi:hypothetical protein
MGKHCYPIENADARDKQLANDRVIESFKKQGLGTSVYGATIALLESASLLTIKKLFAACGEYIRRFIIIEDDVDNEQDIRDAVEKLEEKQPELAKMTTVVGGDIFQYLRESTEKIDFAWIDSMNSRLPSLGRLKHTMQNMKCLAITIVGRANVGGSVVKRVGVISRSIQSVFTHKILDWGYKSTSEEHDGTYMQLFAFGKRWTKCTFRVQKKLRDQQNKNRTRLRLYGHKRVKVVDGPPENWPDKGEMVEL